MTKDFYKRDRIVNLKIYIGEVLIDVEINRNEIISN